MKAKHRRSTAAIALLTIGVCLSGARAGGTGLPSPIPQDWAEAFAAVRADPPPPRLTRDSHYVVSDERRHDLFRDDISNKGGVYIGLGPDQNYLMAGWARPEVLVLLDFDQLVVDLHAVYRAAFIESECAESFIALWHRKNIEEMERLLEREYGGDERLGGIQKAYRKAQRFVSARLNRVKREFGRLKVANYLDDREQYDYVRGLYRSGRVFPVRGDLTASASVKDVAEAARRSGLTIGVLYLSNAEQYFDYGKNYRENMLALPLDESSAVIRTAGTGRDWTADGLYEYVVQSGDNFHAWMANPRIGKVWRMMSGRSINKRTGHSRITALPPDN